MSGALVRPRYAPDVLPIAAAVSARQHAELAARRSERRRWRAHETFVGLALDATELREAGREAGGRRRRTLELERELRELGAGSENSSDSSSASSDSGGEGGDGVDGENSSKGEDGSESGGETSEDASEDGSTSEGERRAAAEATRGVGG